MLMLGKNVNKDLRENREDRSSLSAVSVLIRMQTDVKTQDRGDFLSLNIELKGKMEIMIQSRRERERALGLGQGGDGEKRQGRNTV